MSSDVRSDRSSEKNNELFWVVLGPLSLLMSLSLLFLKAPQDLFFLPLVALSGITLTWCLRLKGFLLALALLIVVSFSQIIWLGQEDSIWFVGSVFSVAASFFITWLTLEEAEKEADGKLGHWRQEALNYLSHFGEASKEKETLAHQLEQTKLSYQQKLSEIASLEKVQELSRVELLAVRSQKEGLDKELTLMKGRLKELEQKIAECDEELEERGELSKRLTEEAAQAKAISREKSDQIDTLLRERDLLESTLNRLQGELEAKELALSAALATPKIVEEPFPEEMIMSDSEFRRLWGQHKQLREQFKEKSDQLDQARKELFIAQEKGAVMERDFQEREYAWAPATQAFHQAFEELSQDYDKALDEIERLQELVR